MYVSGMTVGFLETVWYVWVSTYDLVLLITYDLVFETTKLLVFSLTKEDGT